MDKLSERLWVMRVSLENLTDDELATFDEAIELAKSYEDAPVREVLIVDVQGISGLAILDVEGLFDSGETVRLVREPARRGGW